MQAFFSVFPAQAGMILKNQQEEIELYRIPRASGDDPLTEYSTTEEMKYSPRKRG